MGREKVLGIPGLSDLDDLAYLAYINLDSWFNIHSRSEMLSF